MPATGPGLELPRGSYGPDDWLDPWAAPDMPENTADSPEHAIGEADRLRELLARVLLDEALADGLEVRDGPA